ncbi:MAG TPA: hypothetical protein ENN21_08710 [Spirochaetes bacterium]|nr:hypothetical protein [Spirochaetota bacterium]
MKSRFLVVMAALAMVFAFSFGAQAQTLTSDIVFLKFGYVPLNTYEYDVAGSEQVESSGLAIQGEYNLNFNNFWIGFGLEYEYLWWKDNGDYKWAYLTPQVSAKFAAMGGLYVGAGLAGKYLISYDSPSGSDYDPDKKIDLWVNGILGYYMPIGEAVFLDLEGRFGYNLTNQQWADDDDVKNSYELAFYVGIGYRASASDY